MALVEEFKKLSYRPEGWENPYKDKDAWTQNEGRPPTQWCIDNVFEAGADAMLKGLKKQGVTLSIADQKIEVPGFHIVFIPEE